MRPAQPTYPTRSVGPCCAVDPEIVEQRDEFRAEKDLDDGAAEDAVPAPPQLVTLAESSAEAFAALGVNEVAEPGRSAGLTLEALTEHNRGFVSDEACGLAGADAAEPQGVNDLLGDGSSDVPTAVSSVVEFA